MDNLIFWVILLFLAWVVEAIGTARRRQRQRRVPPAERRPAPQAPRPEPARRPSFEEELRRQLGWPEAASPQPEEEPWVVSLPEEPSVEERTAEAPSAEVEAPARPRAEERPVPAAVSIEAEPVIDSLETLEPAGEKSHERFHARYAAVPPPAQGKRRGPVLTPGNARQAVVLSEILGPPKGLR